MAGDLAIEQAKIDAISQVTLVSFETPSVTISGDGVRTFSLGHQPNQHLASYSGFQKLRAIITHHDLIHTHHHLSGAYSKLFARAYRKPIVVTEHNNHDSYPRSGRFINGITNALADAVVCVSETVRDSFRDWEEYVVSGEKTSIVHNGVDIDRIERAGELNWNVGQECDLNEDAIVVSTAGMLIKQKAHEVLIEAIEQLNTDDSVNQPVELVISGEGDYRKNMEQRISSLTYSDRVHLLGFLDERDQVFKMMHDSDIYAMPSRWEGFCVAALEALTTGTPCVFSDIPAFTNYFNDVTLLHTVDDSEDLAAKLEVLISDKHERQAYGNAGQDLVVSEYSLERTAEKYYDHYDKLV